MSRSLSGRRAPFEFVDQLLAQPEFLDLRRRHRPFGDGPDVARNLEAGELALAEGDQFRLGRALALHHLDESRRHLDIAVIGDADDLGQPNGGVAYELDAIASAVVGGTSLMGGVGTIPGTLIGSFIIGVLRNGLNMNGVSAFIQQIIIGLVIIVTVSIDQLRQTKKK